MYVTKQTDNPDKHAKEGVKWVYNGFVCRLRLTFRPIAQLRWWPRPYAVLKHHGWRDTQRQQMGCSECLWGPQGRRSNTGELRRVERQHFHTTSPRQPGDAYSCQQWLLFFPLRSFSVFLASHHKVCIYNYDSLSNMFIIYNDGSAWKSHLT